jgi:hypothetical protein
MFGFHQTGLLVGASDNFFTRNLDISSAAKLVRYSDTVFREAIEKDLEECGKNATSYLHEVKTKASKYLKGDDICGRSDICARIKDAMLENGSLVFVTGGRSVGKSKIVANIVKAIGEAQAAGTVMDPPQPRVSVIMVDGRLRTDLVLALSEVQATAVATQDMPTLEHSAQPITALAVDFDFKDLNFAHGDVLDAVETLAFEHPQDTSHTVLILDEADTFLDCTGKDGAAARVKALLNAVVLYTKQKQTMSVVLVSSDEGLAYRRLHELEINPDHITSTFVINEATPRECLDLLRTKFGVGEHLSSALLDCYGGNVFDMCMFLKRLPSLYSSAASEINVFMGPALGISRAISAWTADKDNDKAKILQVLAELARTGFVPMNAGDKLTRLLTKFNVCAFLTKDAVEYQVPKEVRAKRMGLIPASQLMRVLIARKLAQIEASEKYRVESRAAPDCRLLCGIL